VSVIILLLWTNEHKTVSDHVI